MTERIKFTVWRDSWLRGAPSYLHADSCRCCLGFLGLACGLTDEQMDGRGEPEEVTGPWPEAIVHSSERDCTVLCQEIIWTNDDDEGDDAEREIELTELFHKAGIDVEFRDGAGPAEAA